MSRNHIYYFRLRTPLKLKTLYPELRKEIRKSLKTGYETVARKRANVIFFELSTLFYHFRVNEKFGELDINATIDNLLHRIELNFMFKNNPNIINFETHDDGSLKLTHGDTAEERENDLELYLKYLKHAPVSQKKTLEQEPPPPPQQTIQIPPQQTIHPQLTLKKGTFLELINKYTNMKKNSGWEDPDTLKTNRRRLGVVLDLIGDLDCSTLTQQNADDFL